MQATTSTGVTPSTGATGRYDIVCIHGAADHPETEKNRLVEQLATLSVEQMHAKLARPDFVVTNAKDKELMLPILLRTDEHVREVFAAAGATRERKQKHAIAEEMSARRHVSSWRRRSSLRCSVV